MDIRKYFFCTFTVGMFIIPLILKEDNPSSIEHKDKPMSQYSQKSANKLINESSPYLLQHADNPVEWYPWGEEAFNKALVEKKPVFLSIGYSTCHWCHVMAHESFEDPEVASLMNKVFVNIKVDREERPDIDSVYMTVCQMMTGTGGWPLTIIMTPDKKPFFAATYIPKTTRFGRMGMLDLIPRLYDAWQNRRDDILDSAEEIAGALLSAEYESADAFPSEALIHKTYNELARNYDKEYGGFGHAPKFPTPHSLLFLLRYWKKTENPHALEMVVDTLRAMRQGGIYDHIGFGFHRYSTDERWLVPHFEKMLYDQALIAIVYTEAYQITGDELFKNTAREILLYVSRDMTSPEGGFYSAEDADSDGEEGKYYLFSVKEVDSILDKEDARFAKEYFSLSSDGNFANEITAQKNGYNILHTSQDSKLMVKKNKSGIEDSEIRIDRIIKNLFEYRKKRVPPHKDDKILTDWNGMMVAAFAKASFVFNEPEYAYRAKQAADFILNNMRDNDGLLMHRYRAGNAGITAHLDDYAYFVWGLIELYQATFDLQYLNNAFELNSTMLKYFYDQQNGGFFFSSNTAEQLLARRKELYDGAVPSGNAVALYNMIRLSRFGASSQLEELIEQTGKLFSNELYRVPSAYTFFISAVDLVTSPSQEIIIAAKEKDHQPEELINALRKQFMPNAIIILKIASSIDSLPPALKYLQDYSVSDNASTVYVCSNFQCSLPVSTSEEMIRLINQAE
jgi:uncharacterized protein YyaL (SSP411 family)